MDLRNLLKKALLMAAGLWLVTGCAALRGGGASGPLESRVTELEARQQTREEALERRLAELEGAMADLRGRQAAAEERIRDLTAALTELKQQAAIQSAGAPVPTAPVEGMPPGGELERAMSLIADGKHEEAREILQRLAIADAWAPWRAQVYVALGESHFAEKHYEEAILSFHRVIEDYPRATEAPHALLREAMCFALLGKEENASFLFRKLLSDYPGSPEAEEVRARMEEAGTEDTSGEAASGAAEKEEKKDATPAP